jgi:hypothetical protein
MIGWDVGKSLDDALRCEPYFATHIVEYMT